MQLPGRSFSSGSKYRYGFNGKEKSNEIYGEGNAYAFEARIYDPRLGRFLSPDPLESSYPSQSTYVFAANNPIALIDYLGLGPDDPPIAKSSDGRNINIPNNATVEYNQKTKDGKDISTTTANSGVKINVASGSVKAINTKAGRFVASYGEDGSFIGYKNYKSGEIMKSFSTISFEATGTVVDSKEWVEKIDGKGKYNEAKMMEKSVIGTLWIRAQYDDGTSKIINGYDFTSGPHGNGPLPNGEYDVSTFSWTSQAGMKLNGGKQGFKLYLSERPDLGRGAFRIHPDCNSWGTAGCIGLRRNDGTKYNNTLLKNFAGSMKDYRKNHPVIKLSFQIPNNPNYNDQGKKAPGN
jgi:RHS repeat-associated protein